MTMSHRILLNAEPFGFGPSAMIADLFSLLHPYFETISYIGHGHTLDLQRGLPYTAIYDMNCASTHLHDVAVNYDLFITAMDKTNAQIASKLGVPTVFYDALAWYWDDLSIMDCVSLYIAQDFYGVRERIANSSAVIVPPLVTPTPTQQKDIILLNLGGLQNPYWPKDVVLRYANLIVKVFRSFVSGRYVIASNADITKGIGGEDIRVYSKDEMAEILPRTKFALMTPGLGNIFDAANHDIPTLFLPPANDTQGQQIEKLQDQSCCDLLFGWHEITGTFINYKNPQEVVMAEILETLNMIQENQYLQSKFELCLKSKMNQICDIKKSKLSHLIDHFGHSGLTEISKIIINFFQKPSRKIA